MTVQISDIQTYRDGGSISFRVERHGVGKDVWLETPFRGEPRSLLVDSVKLQPHSQELAALLRDIDDWHAALPEPWRALIEEVLRKQGPYYNASEEISHAIELSRVVFVQRYLRSDFLQPRKPAPPITDELRAEAKRQPNGWVYVVNPALEEGERIPPAAIVGAWKVDAEGNIVEDGYLPNTRYKGPPHEAEWG